jgi:hypothetical protein
MFGLAYIRVHGSPFVIAAPFVARSKRKGIGGSQLLHGQGTIPMICIVAMVIFLVCIRNSTFQAVSMMHSARGTPWHSRTRKLVERGSDHCSTRYRGRRFFESSATQRVPCKGCGNVSSGQNPAWSDLHIFLIVFLKFCLFDGSQALVPRPSCQRAHSFFAAARLFGGSNRVVSEPRRVSKCLRHSAKRVLRECAEWPMAAIAFENV